MDLKELGSVDPDSHWYYRHKLRMLLRNLSRIEIEPKLCLDVGAGSAFFATHLRDLYPQARLVCIDPNFTESQLALRDGIDRFRIWTSASGDVNLFMDVLEHVQDDLGLLRHYVLRASPGAIFAITVPAFDSLWSGHDVFLGHYRRYRLSELERLVVASGLSIRQSEYWFAPTFPLVWLLRKIRRDREARSDMTQPPSAINKLLERVSSIERPYRGNHLFGSTGFVLAEVPQRPIGLV
jgi:hypothetical protein